MGTGCTLRKSPCIQTLSGIERRGDLEVEHATGCRNWLKDCKGCKTTMLVEMQYEFKLALGDLRLEKRHTLIYDTSCSSTSMPQTWQRVQGNQMREKVPWFLQTKREISMLVYGKMRRHRQNMRRHKSKQGKCELQNRAKRHNQWARSMVLRAPQRFNRLRKYNAHFEILQNGRMVMTHVTMLFMFPQKNASNGLRW